MAYTACCASLASSALGSLASTRGLPMGPKQAASADMVSLAPAIACTTFMTLVCIPSAAQLTAFPQQEHRLPEFTQRLRLRRITDDVAGAAGAGDHDAHAGAAAVEPVEVHVVFILS